MSKRWYDKSDKSQQVLDILKKLDKAAQRHVAENVINIANSIKAIKREQEDVPISIGLERVVGLYQQEKSRRWYDRNEGISTAMKTISTLSDDECLGIIEALSISLTE